MLRTIALGLRALRKGQVTVCLLAASGVILWGDAPQRARADEFVRVEEDWELVIG